MTAEQIGRIARFAVWRGRAELPDEYATAASYEIVGAQVVEELKRAGFVITTATAKATKPKRL